MPTGDNRRRNQPAPRDGATRLKPLILLVEDYEDAREMYRDYLLFAGFRVETAVNGREAIDKARALYPDIVLMDLSLPVLDGWEATRHLKADPHTAHIRIVALSAHAMAAEAAKAAEAGCDGFIAKPCLPEQLASELTRHLAPAVRHQRRKRPAKVR